jgi:peptide/nickel transport system substrate-binding protein
MARDTNWPEQLKAGEVDFSTVDAELYDQLSREPKLTTLTFDTYGVHLFAYQLDPARTTLFQDKRVRQALAYAVDRDAIVRQAFSNLATVAQGTMPILSWAYAPEQLKTKYSYDPRRAEQLLDEAGWRKGADGIRAKDGQRLSFTLWTNAGNKTREQYVTVMQQQWKAIGVEATPKTEEWNAYITRITETHDFEMFLVGFGWQADPDQTSMWSCGGYTGGFNLNKYCNPRVDELLAQGLAEFDQEKRKQLYVEMQNIIMDELPAFIMLFPQDIVAVNKRVHNLRPNGVNTRWNVHTWWVE